MPKHTDFDDYEPVTRPKNRVPITDSGGDSIGSWMRTDSKTRDHVGDPVEQGLTNGREVPMEGLPKVQKRNTPGRVKENWIKRGHGLSYLGLFLFTAVLFFRPYELFPSLSFLSTSAFWLAILTLSVFIPTQLALEGTLTARPREVNLILLLCLFALLSIPLAINPAEAWLTFNDTFIKAVVIFIVIVNVVRTERRLYGLFFLALAVSCLLSLVAINDYRVGNLAIQGRRIRGVIGGIFGNPNDLAIHLVTMVPLAVGAVFGARNTLVKALGALCAILFVAAIVATFSRGGFLALVGAALVLIWKLGRRQRALSIFIATLAVAALILLAPGDYGDRILSIFGLSGDSLGSVSARRNLLTHSIIVSLRNPFGVGMGNYHIMSAREAVSHNAYTQVGAELGFVAMLVYIAFMIVPFRRLLQIERKEFTADQRDRFYYLAVGLQASLVGYMIASFFGSVAYQWYVYYLVGYSFCLHRIYSATVAPSEVVAPGRSLREPMVANEPVENGATSKKRHHEY